MMINQVTHMARPVILVASYRVEMALHKTNLLGHRSRLFG